MALRQISRLYNIGNRGIFTSCRLNVFGPEEFPPPSKIETGVEKKETEAIEAGNEDPFNMNVLKRGPGTKDKPTLIPSAFESRMMGCICEEDAIHINWMWLHKGQPKRCMCGYWYQLVYKPPVE